MKRFPILILLIALHSSLFTTVPACDKTAAKEEVQAAKDTQPPTLNVSEPSLPYGMEGISQREGVISFSGMAEDDQGVVRVKWESSRGGKGWATVARRGTQTDWEVKDIPVEPGDNRITLTAQDAAANAATQTIWVVRTTDVDFISFPDASETDIHLNEATETIFRVAIKESKKVKIESVKLVKVNENGEILDTLGPMYDDGKSEHGDEVPADGVYSAKVTLLEGTEGKVRFRVIVSGVKEGSGGVTASSEPFVIRSLRLWTEEEERQADAIDEQADSTYFELKAKFGHEEAAQRTVEWLKMQPGVASAGASEGGYSFLMESGIQGGYLETIPRKNANPADLKPDLQKEGFEEHCLGDVCDTPDPTAAPASAVRKLAPLQYKMDRRGGLRAGITNPKVLIASPFAGELPVKASVELNRMFGSHRCPIFDRRWIVGEKAGVETFKTMKDYDIIVLDTHGDAICWKAEGGYERCRRGDLPPPGAIVITRTGTPVTKEMSRLYSEERRSGLIVGDRLFSTYAITPAFVYKHKPFRQKSMVYNLSCRSLYNHTMAQAFRNVGVSPYFGYSEYVDTCYDDIVPTIFQSLLKGHTAGRAYSDGVAAYGPTDASCSPVPEPHPATLILAGSSDLKITIEGFNNGSFEQGPGTPPPGWDAKGDVQIITQLGPITAKEGIYMAYLSTGENAEDQSKSALEQPFCVPADKSKISFSYRLVSEEPDEFLNSGYRDTFEAALVIGTARTVLVSETTDKGPWSPLPGVDLEGGDRTAFATDWKTVASELSETARAEGATLAFRLQDNGDLVYDTVALLDNVHLE